MNNEIYLFRATKPRYVYDWGIGGANSAWDMCVKVKNRLYKDENISFEDIVKDLEVFINHKEGNGYCNCDVYYQGKRAVFRKRKIHISSLKKKIYEVEWE
jgi:hypothetical protein